MRPEDRSVAVDFDRLSKASFAPEATIEDQNALWDQTFALEKWHFIARGEAPEFHPYIAAREDVCAGRDVVRAFTDLDRIHVFAKENGLADENGGCLSLSVPVDTIIPWLMKYHDQHHVYGIWFNSNEDSFGYYAPMVQLSVIKDHLAMNRRS